MGSHGEPWGAMGAMTVDMLPMQARRWHIIGGVGLVLVVLLIAGIFLVRQHQLAAQASGRADLCAPSGNAHATAPLIVPGDTLPVTLPAGAPRVVSTVNRHPLYAPAVD